MRPCIIIIRRGFGGPECAVELGGAWFWTAATKLVSAPVVSSPTAALFPADIAEHIRRTTSRFKNTSLILACTVKVYEAGFMGRY